MGTNGKSGSGLSPELIAELMAGRTRNAYAPKLNEFIESDEPAINVRDTWSLEFKGKKVTALVQGFRGAIKNLDNREVAESLDVKQMGEDVFLLDKVKAAAVVLAAQADES